MSVQRPGKFKNYNSSDPKAKEVTPTKGISHTLAEMLFRLRRAGYARGVFSRLGGEEVVPPRKSAPVGMLHPEKRIL